MTGAGFAIVNISSILLIATVFTVLNVLDDGNTFPTITYMEAILGVGLGGTGLWFLTTYIISHFRKLFGKEKLIKNNKDSKCNYIYFSISYNILCN